MGLEDGLGVGILLGILEGRIVGLFVGVNVAASLSNVQQIITRPIKAISIIFSINTISGQSYLTKLKSSICLVLNERISDDSIFQSMRNLVMVML